MDNLPMTEFDMVTSGTYLQMLKAYLPYTSLNEQRMISITIRIIELVQTINFFKNTNEPSPLFRSNHERENILKEIRRYCPVKDLEILDMMSQYSNINSIISTFQSSSTSSSDTKEGPFGSAGFLSREQKEMYEKYKEMLG